MPHRGGGNVKAMVAAVLMASGNVFYALDGTRTSERETRLTLLARAMKPFRPEEAEMRERWERDEAEGFRKLPARAWPAYQPNEEDLPSILNKLKLANCLENEEDNEHFKYEKIMPKYDTNTSQCEKQTFDLATALVFNNLNVKRGMDMYLKLANINEYSDAMVAYGIVYLEGFGVEQDEEKGLVFIKRAMKLGSLQAMYEYGTVLYTGVEGIIDENEELAFSLFDEAASKGHIGAQFMAADMMLEACGTPMNVDKAIRYLAKSAESGHRFARQRMRELFDECKGEL